MRKEPSTAGPRPAEAMGQEPHEDQARSGVNPNQPGIPSPYSGAVPDRGEGTAEEPFEYGART